MGMWMFLGVGLLVDLHYKILSPVRQYKCIFKENKQAVSRSPSSRSIQTNSCVRSEHWSNAWVLNSPLSDARAHEKKVDYVLNVGPLPKI